MANEEHVHFLKQGADTWNQWKQQNPDIKPDLRWADLHNANLQWANLRGADLHGAGLSQADLRGSNLHGADLSEADLTRANLSEADLMGTDLSEAVLIGTNLRNANLSETRLIGGNLREANLRGADLHGADLRRADLHAADLREANLSMANLHAADLRRADLYAADLRETNLSMANLHKANLIRTALASTNLEGANLSDCLIYEISAWDLKLAETTELNLVITPPEEPTITVDHLEVAQFIYLLLNNKKIRAIFTSITSKMVLILGRFTPERREMLDAIREKLRQFSYLPVLFDFKTSSSKDIHETVMTLSRVARFVIADITYPDSIPPEFVSIVKQLPSLPIQPLLRLGAAPWSAYDAIKSSPSVLTLFVYSGLEDLLASLANKVIGPAERKARELEKK